MTTTSVQMYENDLEIQLGGERMGPAMHAILVELELAGWEWVDVKELQRAGKRASDLAERSVANLVGDLVRFGMVVKWQGRARVTSLGRRWLDEWDG